MKDADIIRKVLESIRDKVQGAPCPVHGTPAVLVVRDDGLFQDAPCCEAHKALVIRLITEVEGRITTDRLDDFLFPEV